MFKIEIDTDNEAFVEFPEAEIVNILSRVVNKLRNGDTSGKLLDSNGNTVGNFSYKRD